MHLAAEQAQWAEMRRIGGARPRTRGLARNEETRINYAEVCRRGRISQGERVPKIAHGTACLFVMITGSRECR